ncbi:MAG: hypothetical protein L0H26_09370 [Microlunatus sp.]|nr:hypothetical protein [Microlunatus sp.]
MTRRTDRSTAWLAGLAGLLLLAGVILLLPAPDPTAATMAPAPSMTPQHTSRTTPSPAHRVTPPTNTSPPASTVPTDEPAPPEAARPVTGRGAAPPMDEAHGDAREPVAGAAQTIAIPPGS